MPSSLLSDKVTKDMVPVAGAAVAIVDRTSNLVCLPFQVAFPYSAGGYLAGCGAPFHRASEQQQKFRRQLHRNM
jgi:hypothetical protein